MNDEKAPLKNDLLDVYIALKNASSEEEAHRYLVEHWPKLPEQTPEEIAEEEAMDEEIGRALVENLNRNVLAEHEEDERRKARARRRRKPSR